jgi:hypothetical protein
MQAINLKSSGRTAPELQTKNYTGILRTSNNKTWKETYPKLYKVGSTLYFITQRSESRTIKARGTGCFNL